MHRYSPCASSFLFIVESHKPNHIFPLIIKNLFIISYYPMDYSEQSLQLHKKHHWKIEIASKVPLNTLEDLATFYSPWVAAPCLKIAENNEDAYTYTRKSNTVAVITDGSAVLWLWNIGWLAGLPVMEWKAILFKKFWNIDAIPIVLSTQEPDEIIKCIEEIAINFWGINLEDIAAPKCFYIEEELKKRLSIPVFHDDQHWTAIVVLAWIINALKIKNDPLNGQKIVISWAWAAALAIGKLLRKAWATNIIFCDSQWIISSSRKDLNPYKQEVVQYNKNNIEWTLHEALIESDIFIGVSKWDLLHAKDIAKMHTDPIIFALANPIPEIMPEEAKKGGAYIIATWRSDYPNQVNNVLVFPWIFRWALDGKITKITDEHKIAAAHALANSVDTLSIDKILPTVFEKQVVENIANAIKEIW